MRRVSQGIGGDPIGRDEKSGLYESEKDGNLLDRRVKSSVARIDSADEWRCETKEREKKTKGRNDDDGNYGGRLKSRGSREWYCGAAFSLIGF